MANYKMVNSDQLDNDLKSVANKIREKSQLTDLLKWPAGFLDGIDQCSSLNFSVIGGISQPSSPLENTIWINTETEVTGWVFSATQPESPNEGMVWIVTANSSSTQFNALKKNEIQVYPQSAKQYIGGSFVGKTASVYQDGAWTSFWDGVLFPPASNWNSATNGHGSAGIYDDGIYLTEEWINRQQYQQATSKVKLDVSPYSKLCARMKSSGNSSTKVVALSTASDSNVLGSNFVAKTELNTQTEGVWLECDISTITGEYYVVVGQHTTSGTSNEKTVFDKVWME